VPGKRKTRKRREKDWEKYGKPTTWKLPPVVGDAIERAAWSQEVSQRELVQYFLTVCLQGLAQDKLRLPKRENDRQHGPRYLIDQPDIPDEFLKTT
jgi:hypothetical protein